MHHRHRHRHGYRQSMRGKQTMHYRHSVRGYGTAMWLLHVAVPRQAVDIWESRDEWCWQLLVRSSIGVERGRKRPREVSCRIWWLLWLRLCTTTRYRLLYSREDATMQVTDSLARLLFEEVCSWTTVCQIWSLSLRWALGKHQVKVGITRMRRGGRPAPCESCCVRLGFMVGYWL